MTTGKIGLLPLYLELYDNMLPEMRGKLQNFLDTIASELEKRGVEVVTGDICRLKNEFEMQISKFEQSDTDAIVTLHLAYSPSLESAEVLAKTRLPLIVLDTTPDPEFGFDAKPDMLLYNHGIHGVQDMCNLLLRNKKPFFIEAGHWRNSDVLDRTVEWTKAAFLASAFRNQRVGLIGEQFTGMGDFAVPFSDLKKQFGIEVVEFDYAKIPELLPEPEAIDKEMTENQNLFDCKLDKEVHLNSVKAGLLVRRWLKTENLSAFSQNFMHCGTSTGMPTVPFLEASKAMARGIGYAGEGDLPCAALLAAIFRLWPESTFTEMFCPDWTGNRIFLNHMGELNYKLSGTKPQLLPCGFPIADTNIPALAAGRFKAGKATLVNLAPGPDGQYTLIVAPVEVCEPAGEDGMIGMVRGWIKPEMPLQEFLAGYSRSGGTHHLAMVYENPADILLKWAEIMNWPGIELR